MTKDDIYPSRYLKATDVPHPLVVTIDRVEQEAVGRAKERKPVLFVRELTKGLIVNATNFAKITTLTGELDTDNWTGKRIEVFATTCEFSGEEVECLRIRKPRAVARSSRPAPATVNAVVDDDITGPVDEEMGI